MATQHSCGPCMVVENFPRASAGKVASIRYDMQYVFMIYSVAKSLPVISHVCDLILFV